ncbi:hypothetical protein PtrEW13061_012228, partial [Pyrenophora tritici-repentis]
SIRRRAKLLTFNSARSITVALSSGLLASCVRLELEKQYGSEMRRRRNSKKHRPRSSVRRLSCSVKLSSSRGVWRGRGSRKRRSLSELRKQLNARAKLKLNTRKKLSNKLNNASVKPH